MIKKIVLIGMTGVGKTTVGEILSRKLNLFFMDTDEMIEYEFGDISKIFTEFGENSFREMEKKVIKFYGDFENYVIATGGGTVLAPESAKILKENGLVIWLRGKSEEIVPRLSKEREILKGDPLKKHLKLSKEREMTYKGLADFSVSVCGKTPEEIVEEILEKLLEFYQ